MRAKTQKITLSASRDIPFDKLALSQANVRHVKAGVSIEELAEDIARRTLLSSITVRPLGAKIAFTGGLDCTDHGAIWEALDRVRIKHPDMVLLHGGSPRGAEKIASCWADNLGCAQIVFKPDWTRHGKAAPFKRNDALLAVLPIGLIVFPGSGITDNLADKARAMGIPLFDFRPKAGAQRPCLIFGSLVLEFSVAPRGMPVELEISAPTGHPPDLRNAATQRR